MNFARLGVLAQQGGGDAAAGAIGTVGLIIYLALIVVVIIIGLWKTFEKAGQPGWGAIIPFYNIILLPEIAGKPIWWVVLFLIPCVNVVVSLLVMLDVAKAFGKGAGFGIGLWLLGFIFFPILGFSDARYIGPAKA